MICLVNNCIQRNFWGIDLLQGIMLAFFTFSHGNMAFIIIIIIIIIIITATVIINKLFLLYIVFNQK